MLWADERSGGSPHHKSPSLQAGSRMTALGHHLELGLATRPLLKTNWTTAFERQNTYECNELNDMPIAAPWPRLPIKVYRVTITKPTSQAAADHCRLGNWVSNSADGKITVLGRRQANEKNRLWINSQLDCLGPHQNGCLKIAAHLCKGKPKCNVFPSFVGNFPPL